MEQEALTAGKEETYAMEAQYEEDAKLETIMEAEPHDVTLAMKQDKQKVK